MSRKDEIEEILEKRKIKTLLHFTQIENLPSIIKNGLLTKDNVDESAKCNDEHRLDNHTDTISVSIHHPNSPMFYKYRQQNPKADWCVIGIKAEILLEKEALFCKRNAASSSISNKSEDDLKSPDSLEGMFQELSDTPSRDEQFLKNYDPTDVQAEVLIKGNIAPEYIKGIVFTSRQAKKDHQELIGERMTRIHGENQNYLSRRDIQRKYR
ncbi:DarT ssDNA thymidine ADP-ribosyltransferase family protein [Marinomonas sp. 15G1-11]|uniref:DarT ssDNA thymidine ADP-ribosyltransferase family protein n=1 Tax=Marinomonas phaeophyticola TaxID=3004091 RepID=A0ABT4JPF0_9GAMM|nr:DarT ssDNA thymidine ADP-ribosyltransferase family protein [Marinomonas sp. 15G1-11]MCZ2720181.1 DarT ssDNA thymidine ADP-ribosyltransferase family protein [Marinomonas sp. 15G1-11]